ncbi:hypothetical protein Bpfe_004832, partial [Biomphalaria pfeifferi]
MCTDVRTVELGKTMCLSHQRQMSRDTWCNRETQEMRRAVLHNSDTQIDVPKYWTTSAEPEHRKPLD